MTTINKKHVSVDIGDLQDERWDILGYALTTLSAANGQKIGYKVYEKDGRVFIESEDIEVYSVPDYGILE